MRWHSRRNLAPTAESMALLGRCFQWHDVLPVLDSETLIYFTINDVSQGIGIRFRDGQLTSDVLDFVVLRLSATHHDVVHTWCAVLVCFAVHCWLFGQYILCLVILETFVRNHELRHGVILFLGVVAYTNSQRSLRYVQRVFF